MSAKHETVFTEFSSTFSKGTVSRWLQMVEKWETDPVNAPNPYREPAKGT